MTSQTRFAWSLRCGRKSGASTRLAPWFPDAAEPIGEAWYLADRELPLLVKLIFTSERLSVQVHPDDGEDGPRGKTEMWHILEAEPGAAIALGFPPAPHPRASARGHLSGEIEHLVNWMPVKAGETYFTPAHTVHAIGAGIVLCEIQQNSDVTYRLWDYGRPRAHPRGAGRADRRPDGAPRRLVARLGEGHEELVRSKHFVTELVRLERGRGIHARRRRSASSGLCSRARAPSAAKPFAPGEVWLLPETGEQPAVTGDGAGFLRTYVPG